MEKVARKSFTVKTETGEVRIMSQSEVNDFVRKTIQRAKVVMPSISPVSNAAIRHENVLTSRDQLDDRDGTTSSVDAIRGNEDGTSREGHYDLRLRRASDDFSMPPNEVVAISDKLKKAAEKGANPLNNRSRSAYRGSGGRRARFIRSRHQATPPFKKQEQQQREQQTKQRKDYNELNERIVDEVPMSAKDLQQQVVWPREGAKAMHNKQAYVSSGEVTTGNHDESVQSLGDSAVVKSNEAVDSEIPRIIDKQIPEKRSRSSFLAGRHDNNRPAHEKLVNAHKEPIQPVFISSRAMTQEEIRKIVSASMERAQQSARAEIEPMLSNGHELAEDPAEIRKQVAAIALDAMHRARESAQNEIRLLIKEAFRRAPESEQAQIRGAVREEMQKARETAKEEMSGLVRKIIRRRSVTRKTSSTSSARQFSKQLFHRENSESGSSRESSQGPFSLASLDVSKEHETTVTTDLPVTSNGSEGSIATGSRGSSNYDRSRKRFSIYTSPGGRGYSLFGSDDLESRTALSVRDDKPFDERTVGQEKEALQKEQREVQSKQKQQATSPRDSSTGGECKGSEKEMKSDRLNSIGIASKRDQPHEQNRPKVSEEEAPVSPLHCTTADSAWSSVANGEQTVSPPGKNKDVVRPESVVARQMPTNIQPPEEPEEPKRVSPKKMSRPNVTSPGARPMPLPEASPLHRVNSGTMNGQETIQLDGEKFSSPPISPTGNAQKIVQGASVPAKMPIPSTLTNFGDSAPLECTDKGESRQYVLDQAAESAETTEVQQSNTVPKSPSPRKVRPGSPDRHPTPNVQSHSPAHVNISPLSQMASPVERKTDSGVVASSKCYPNVGIPMAQQNTFEAILNKSTSMSSGMPVVEAVAGYSSPASPTGSIKDKTSEPFTNEIAGPQKSVSTQDISPAVSSHLSKSVGHDDRARSPYARPGRSTSPAKRLTTQDSQVKKGTSEEIQTPVTPPHLSDTRRKKVEQAAMLEDEYAALVEEKTAKSGDRYRYSSRSKSRQRASSHVHERKKSAGRPVSSSRRATAQYRKVNTSFSSDDSLWTDTDSPTKSHYSKPSRSKRQTLSNDRGMTTSTHVSNGSENVVTDEFLARIASRKGSIITAEELQKLLEATTLTQRHARSEDRLQILQSNSSKSSGPVVYSTEDQRFCMGFMDLWGDVDAIGDRNVQDETSTCVGSRDDDSDDYETDNLSYDDMANMRRSRRSMSFSGSEDGDESLYTNAEDKKRKGWGWW